MPMLGEGGGTIDDCTSNVCKGGGGSMDEESHDTCEGDAVGGGSMDGVVVDTSGLRGRGKIRRVGRLVNGKSGYACGGE